MLAVFWEAYLMEHCWHGKLAGMGQCREAGRYGNPDAPLKFMRAARWCFAHKHADDRLLEANECATHPVGDQKVTDNTRTS